MKKLNSVLLIDDDPGTNLLHRIVLERAHVTNEIEIALNGREALDYLTSAAGHQPADQPYPTPDLILLDINMPVMDGWEFLDAYKTLGDPQKGNIVIVMLTTSLNPDDRRKAEQNPVVSGFRHKPLTEEMLSEIMLKYFPDHL